MNRHGLRILSARELRWMGIFGCVLVVRLLYPFFDSPLIHVFSDPQRHWENGRDFLHPNVIGSGDPIMYQLWVYLLRAIAGSDTATVLAACGLLCAAMPYGWYRALRELVGRERSLQGAVLIGLWPGALGLYGYFMTETLVLTLTGFAFALTLRAVRKRGSAAFALACAVWLAASFTRIVVLPIALLCLAWLWMLQARKLRALLLAVCMSAAIAIPAGLHGRIALHYFAPLGNLYLNEIYHAGLRKNIQISFGPQGTFGFGSPSYYNPTFYPFSDWSTARQGTYEFSVDTSHGRADWIRELERARAQPGAQRWRDFAENLCFLFFGVSWPDDDLSTLLGTMTVWSRWLFLPAVLWTAVAAAQGRFRGCEWLLPLCALLSLSLLVVQREGIMEGRYRKPLEPIFLAAIVLSLRARPDRGELP
jgi:hypothetical protein